MRELSGKVALVTGSTSGIGLGIARKLAAEGARVVMHGTASPAEIEPMRAALASETGGDVAYLPADVSKPEAITDLFQQIKQKFGPVDILVNNAGIGKVTPFMQMTAADWDKTMAVNLSAAFHTMQAAIPDMQSRGWGRIINIGSAHSLVGAAGKSAYVASKFGLLGLTKAVALEVAEAGITCNVVCPGYVKTPMVEGRIKEEAAKAGVSEEKWAHDVMLAEQPTHRFVSTEEIAATVAFLCSPGAASMTGAAVTLDGGWTAH